MTPRPGPTSSPIKVRLIQVTETGAGYTWSVNSRESADLWSNDAVSDPPARFYLRTKTQARSGPPPAPIREAEPYTIRHGQVTSLRTHQSRHLAGVAVCALEGSVKISLLGSNRTERKRRLTVTLFNELVLGTQRRLPLRISSPKSTTKPVPSSPAILSTMSLPIALRL